jgi:hypothetical protein
MNTTAKNITLPAADEIQDARGNKSQGWLQSDKAAHQAMWKLGVKHPMALAVLHFMVSKLSRGTNGVVISAAALSKQMGIAPRTVQNTIAILRDCKFVQVLKSGNVNVYIINSRVAWQGDRGARFASFNAQILVDESEQLQPVDQLIEEADQLLQVPVMTFNEEIQLDAIDPPAPAKGEAQGSLLPND